MKQIIKHEIKEVTENQLWNSVYLFNYLFLYLSENLLFSREINSRDWDNPCLDMMQ